MLQAQCGIGGGSFVQICSKNFVMRFTRKRWSPVTDGKIIGYRILLPSHYILDRHKGSFDGYIVMATCQYKFFK